LLRLLDRERRKHDPSADSQPHSTR
jgi:hypothetical protein